LKPFLGLKETTQTHTNMAIKTRSQTRTAAQRTLNNHENTEATFRTIHKAGHILVNPSDLDDKNRILWWTTGIEEGVFTDADIPPADYSEVYKAMHGK